MKHIKKRFFLEGNSETINIDKSKFEIIENIDNGIDSSILANRKQQIAFIENEDKKLIAGFVQNINGKNYVFPVPDPTLVYFHNAQFNLRLSIIKKHDLLRKLDLEPPKTSIPIHELYDYYGTTCSVIINLFTSIESFLNQQIPNSYFYKKVTQKSTEIFNSKQIMEYIDFKTKATLIIPEITKKDFFKKQSSANQMIWNLKDFRDEIIHTKPEDDILRYKNLIKKSLNFKYDTAIQSVATYFNYHNKNYIEECDCNEDF